VAVVEPGSKDDPFSTKNVAAPADPPATKPDADQSKPGGQDDAWTDKEDSKLLSELDEQIQARVRAAHSGLDKKVAQLTKRSDELTQKLADQAKSAREAERQARSEGLSEAEKAVLKNQWSLEDKEDLLKTKESAVSEYFRQVKAYDLVARYEKFGLTGDDLESAEDTDEMELIAERIRGDFLEKGGKPKPTTPAGTKADSDIGGGPPGPEPFKLGEEKGVAGMAANIKSMFKQPGNK
jgi:hypothetical protein